MRNSSRAPESATALLNAMANDPSVNDEDRAELVAYLDGELGDEASRALEAKLNRHPGLRAEAETLRRAWDLLDYLPRPEPSTDFTNRTLEQVAALDSRPARTGWLPWSHPRAWRVGWAAALLLVAAGGYQGMTCLLQRVAPGLTEPVDPDQHLVRDLRVIENKRLYDHVDSLEFLRGLDAPELFGDGS